MNMMEEKTLTDFVNENQFALDDYLDYLIDATSEGQ